MKFLNVLGLDPALANTGYAVAVIDARRRTISKVTELGTIKTAKSGASSMVDLFDRAKQQAAILHEIVVRHRIDIAASEMPVASPNSQYARTFGIGIGLVASLPVPVVPFAPMDLKLAAVGSKTADKEAMVRWALALTRDSDVDWPVCSFNDWLIPHGKGYVAKHAEHRADALAAINALVHAPDFNEIVMHLRRAA